MAENRDEKRGMDRRRALKYLATGGAMFGGGALGLFPSIASSTTNDAFYLPPHSAVPGRVVRVHKAGMRSGLFPDPDASRLMVDKAVQLLAGETDPGRAWLNFVSPEDRVLIKINCLGTRMMSSMKEIVFAVADAIRDAGVKDNNIIILDMFASNMMGGRFDQQTSSSKMRILAHKDGSYHKTLVEAGPAKARFSDYYLWSTAVINIPPIKDHDLSGVTCTMKNMTFGVVEKPHLNHSTVNESMAHLYAHDEIRSRVRLHIIDGSRIMYDGGPKFTGSSHALHECIYATCDPVAMDSIAYELIENLRVEKGMRTLADVGRPPKFLQLAEQMGLGIADRKKIHLESVEMSPHHPTS